MPCPSCGARAEPDAWICGVCEHILDPSVLEPKEDEDLPEQAERTRLVAWAPPGESNEVYPDAVILGDVGVAEDEFSVVAGAQAEGDGRTSTFLFYAGGSSTRVVHPHAIPHATNIDDTLPRTPYEDFILSCIDGQKSVRTIQKESGLAPQEIVVTLLTLMDKGAVDIRTLDGRPGASPRADIEQLTEAEDGLPGVARVDDEFEDLPEVDSFSEVEPSGDLSAEMLVNESAVFERPPSADLEDDDSHFDETDNYGAADEPPLVTAAAEQGTDDLDEHMREASADFEPVSSNVERSDVWRSADGLVEEESTVEQYEPDYAALPGEDLPPVMPSPLEDEDGTEPTRELELPKVAAAAVAKKAAQRRRTPARPGSASVRPAVSSVKRGPSITRSKSQAARGAEPSPSVEGIAPPQPAKAAKPVLDVSFLEEVPPSVVARVPVVSRPAPEPVNIDDLQQHTPAPPPGTRLPAVEPPPPEDKAENNIEKEQERLQEQRRRNRDAAASAEPVDSVRMLKAERLFEQAIKDKAEGNLVSARMNVKLALTFDPGNELYAETFDEMSKNPGAAPASSGKGRSIARELYDQATSAENRGDVDEAVELLEKAIRESKNPAFFNRLGVILAMKKQQFSRAQEMIEKAIELAPSNATYEKNLHKVLSRAALHARKGSNGKRRGIRGLFGRRK